MSRATWHFRIWTFIEIISYSPNANGTIVAASEHIVVVRGDGVDGRIVCFHFTHQITSFSWPQFDVSGPATGNDRMASRKEAKAAYPIFMGVIKGFDDLAGLQIPLFDAGISGSAE